MKKLAVIFQFILLISYCSYSQNVGIGTNTPEGLLHVKGINWTKAILENNTGDPRGYFGIDNNGTITIGANAYWNGSAWVYPNTGSSLYMLFHRLNHRYEFRVRPDGGVQSTAMSIDTGSNVAIGGNLVIDQENGNTGTIGNSLRFGNFSGEGIGSKRNSGSGQYGLDFYTNSINRMTVANNGNVGIGTIAPAEKLDVNGAINIGTTNSTHAGSIRFNPANNDFEGYDGTEWRSLTAGAGQLPPSTITPVNVTTGSKLGFSVAIGSEFAFAGAPLDDISGRSDQGSVLVYRKHPVTGSWDYFQKITLPTGNTGDQFGYSVAFNGKYLAVGSPYRDILGNVDCGAVTIFLQNKNTGVWEWYLNTELSRQTAGSNFGYAMDFKELTLLIGAPKEDVGSETDAGAIYHYYYSFNNLSLLDYFGSPVGPLLSTIPLANDNFGSAVKIIRATGATINYALIGSPNADPDGINNAGAAYLIRQFVSGSTISFYFDKIVAPDKTVDDNFGFSLDGIFNEVLVVAAGSKRENGSQANQGKVYLYAKHSDEIFGGVPVNLVVSSSFTSNDGGANNFFGTSLSLINTQSVLIGSPGNNDGAIYRYIANSYQSWVLDKKITDPQPSTQQNFGHSLALNNGVIICGVPLANSNTGKVYFRSVVY